MTKRNTTKAIIGKIHFYDFPLTYDCENSSEVSNKFGIDIDNNGLIDILLISDGNKIETDYTIINDKKRGKFVTCQPEKDFPVALCDLQISAISRNNSLHREGNLSGEFDNFYSVEPDKVSKLSYVEIEDLINKYPDLKDLKI